MHMLCKKLFKGSLWDECLNTNQLMSPEDDSSKIVRRRRDYT